MVRIVVDRISLCFPLYARASMSALEGVGEVDKGRLIFDKRGRIIAVKALDDISFELKRGDRLGIVGSNGSGKTSLLQVLAGIIPPDLGSVTVEGRSTNLINLNLGLDVEATGHGNITLCGLAGGHSRAIIEEKRQGIAEFSELGPFLDLPVETYSAGMRMRLSFAIATAFHPDILLLDEWLSAGDASFRARAGKRMSEFVDQAGILILASHNRKLLEDNCNRAIWLKDGKLFAEGPVAEIFDHYEADSRQPKKPQAPGQPATVTAPVKKVAR